MAAGMLDATGKRRRLFQLLIASMVIGALAFGWHQWHLAHPDRSHAMTELTKNMRTYCVGRLLIDLPEGTTWDEKASGARIGDVSLSITTGLTQQQFEEQVGQRWQELQTTKQANRYGKPYLAPPQRLETPEKGVVFIYEFMQMDMQDAHGIWQKVMTHEAEGYLWRDGTMFKINPRIKSKDEIIALMPRLRARHPDEIPTQPGLCLHGAFVEGYYDLDQREEMIWGFDLPSSLGLVVRQAKVWEPASTPSKRERDSRGMAQAWLGALIKPGDVFEEHLFRLAERKVGELIGEELVVGTVDGNQQWGFDTSISGEWEFPGRGSPASIPQIAIHLSPPKFKTPSVPSPAGGFPDPKDAPHGPTEAQFFEVWDAVISSVRIRPGALTPPPSARNDAPPPPSLSQDQLDADRRTLDGFIAEGRPPAPPKD